jgi:hypothetical protein
MTTNEEPLEMVLEGVVSDWMLLSRGDAEAIELVEIVLELAAWTFGLADLNVLEDVEELEVVVVAGIKFDSLDWIFTNILTDTEDEASNEAKAEVGARGVDTDCEVVST